MEIILGTAQFAHRYGIMAQTSEAYSSRGISRGRNWGLELLAAASDLNIHTIDTAPSYGGAESLIGRRGGSFAVHTKLPKAGDSSLALASSLAHLRRISVEVLYLHDSEAVLDPQGPRLAAAAALVGAGAEALGASVYTPMEFEAAVDNPLISVVQLPLNVLDRRVTDEALQNAASLGTRLIARSTLLQGLLGNPEAARGRVPSLDGALDAFLRSCASFERAPVEVALQWVRARPGISAMVLGAEHPAQLQSLIVAAEAEPLTIEEQNVLAMLFPTVGEDVDPRRWS